MLNGPLLNIAEVSGLELSTWWPWPSACRAGFKGHVIPCSYTVHGLILYCHCIEILDNFIFDLCVLEVKSEKQWSIANERVCFLSTCGIHDAPWAQNSGVMMCGSSVRFKASTREACSSCDWWYPNLFQVQKEMCSEKYKWPETLSLSFLLPNHFTLKMISVEWKEKDDKP